MNFCASQLLPEISTNKPSADGHEVSNLISEDSLCRSRGYMGEYFLKPPIDIILHFPVSIDISQVLIGAQLRTQCSVAFSILTNISTSSIRNNSPISSNPAKNNSSKRKIYNPNINTTEGIRQAHGTGVYECGSLVPLQEYEDENDGHGNDVSSDDDVYLSVSNFNTNGEETVLLSNCFYRHWFDVPRPKTETILKGASSVYTNNMRHTNRDALRCVKKLMIRIHKTQHPGPCVLSRIEVWGQPAMSSSIRQRKDLLNKWQGHKISLVNEPRLPRMYNSHEDKESNSSSSQLSSAQFDIIQENCEIPEEFFDPITCEVMTIPLLLPTGHTVDSQTLERYFANESQWGRPASDPFSGLAFKEGRGPVPNVGLKARIDRYLLLNGNHSEFKNIGRSLHYTKSDQFFTKSESTSRSINNSPSDTEKVNTDEGISKRKHSQLETETVSEDEGDLCNSKSNSGSSSNSTSSWSTFNSSQLNNLNQNSCAEAKRYLHPVNTDRISKTIPMIDNNAPAPGRSRLQMLNQVASLTRPSSSSRTKHLIKPSTSRIIQPFVIENEDSSSKQHNTTDLLKKTLHKSKPSSLICGDRKTHEFNLDSVLSSDGSECPCGLKDDLYNLICKHILCRTCVTKPSKVKKIICSVCGVESQNSEISKHHKKSVFL